MDQAILRLLAVHYRPLLMPSEPVLVDMSVPALCQAAAAFGLGLLFQGSAHRHIASILLAELGRPLGGPSNSTTANGSNDHAGADRSTNLNDPSGAGGNDPNSTGASSKMASAGGTGGFAGDSRELISLSAGFALGLVLLQVVADHFQ